MLCSWPRGGRGSSRRLTRRGSRAGRLSRPGHRLARPTVSQRSRGRALRARRGGRGRGIRGGRAPSPRPASMTVIGRPEARRARTAWVALRLAQVVGLGVGLAGEDLVGELGVGAVRERVVAAGPPGPDAEGPAGLAGGVLELVVRQPVALGIDRDGPVPGADHPAGDPRLRDRLARPVRTDDQGVPAAACADGDAHGPAALVAADGQAAAVDPPPASDATTLEAPSARVERRAAVPRVLRPVRALAEIVEMPPGADRGGEHGGGGDEPGPGLTHASKRGFCPRERRRSAAMAGPKKHRPSCLIAAPVWWSRAAARSLTSRAISAFRPRSCAGTCAALRPMRACARICRRRSSGRRSRRCARRSTSSAARTRLSANLRGAARRQGSR
jgi:hypothetical protein